MEKLIKVTEAKQLAYAMFHAPILRTAANRLLDDAPAADAVTVVHGHWIERQAVKGQVYCSECATIEKVTDSNYKSRHCPNCGAMMDGERREGE